MSAPVTAMSSSAPAPASSASPSSSSPSKTSATAPSASKTPLPTPGNGPKPPAPASATPGPAREPDTGGEWAKPKRYEFKIDGQTVTREFKSEAELQTYLQKGLASEKRFSEASEKEKRIQALIAKGAQGNLEEVVKEIWGVDLDEWGEKHFAKKWQKATMSEEERKLADAEERAQKYERQLKEIEAGKQRDAKKALEEKTWKEFEGHLHKALESSGLEKSRETLWLLGDVNDAALAAGIELTPQQMVAEAEHRAASYARGTVLKKKGVALLEALGSDVVNEVLRAEVERRRGAATQPPTVAANTGSAGGAPAEKTSEGSQTAAQRRAQRRPEPSTERPMSPGRLRTQRRFGLVD